ncbi:uncharacterized protein LOC130281834 isoform X2 [Hyla sarda]|uniref:uncharacterized protein LOC130281834 isoform X2 n=1 Tax=Hyla sarda TaxID=327740 RepID=UPI0024C3D964|nr:uncharacterized protein LOC130281834 isoform X2 [Hyla sarda]
MKKYIKILTLPQYKISKNPIDRLCQQVYLNLVASLHAKMKAWPNKLDNNNLYVKKFEKCLEMINESSLDEESIPPDALIKILISLPWDMKHIFIVTIAEKQFQKKYIPSSVTFFSKIFDILGKKHWALFLDVLERLTEYTLEDYTEGSLKACMEILHSIIIWNLQRGRRKNDKLSIVLKNVMSKLVYHHDYFVRRFVTPLMLGKDFVSFDVSKLGNSFIKVDEDLVEMCIREHINHNCPGIVLNHEVPTKSLHSSLYEAKTPEGHSLVYVFKQRTLNDILQTNRTVDAYEHFQEMSRLIKTCQKHENIVALRNVPVKGILPFFVVENGKPLLEYLHKKENQLTWFQMIQILIDITTAVHHCHSNKILLCDITPASFIIVNDGSLKTKLASFLHARSGECEDSSNTADGYINDINFLCFQGDSKENIAAYFSSPESLSNRTFSKYTDVWMLATTLYSVLLYGRRPFEELSHVNIFDFVNEIKSQHTARKPISIPPDLWNILQTNLDFHATTRTLTEAVLQDLKTYQNNLGPRSHTFYTVTSVSSYINPEEIQRGYVDDTGNYILEETEELEGNSVDSVILDGYLIQTVTARMSRNTRRQILQLDNENILKINEIKTDFYKTVLLSNAFNGHLLSETNQEVSRDQLFSYFHQITLGLQELHKHNIVLCDLRCSSIYINPNEGTLKIGHVGRAVSLDGISTFPYAMKLMPADASKWSAPEVRDNSMYSKASDIFNLAAVFWEAISLHINTIYQNQPLESFQHCRTHLEEYCHSVSIQNTSEDPVNKLVKCVLKCWNRNPTRRPTLDVILNTIKEITTHNATGCSTAVERIEYFVSEDEEEEEMSEDVYETIIDCSSTDLSSDSSDFYDFSSTGFYVDYAWGSVVREFTLIHVPSNNTRPFIELKETSTYNDIGISPRNKTHSKRGIIL